MSDRRIYKYRLEHVDYQELQLPPGARILHVGLQGGVLHLWAMIDAEEQTLQAQAVYIVPTGSPVPSGAEEAGHIGTVQQDRFVWHVFAPMNQAVEAAEELPQ